MTTTIAIITLVLASSFGLIAIQNNRVPQLGVTQGLFQPLGRKPNGVSTQTDDEKKRIEPLPFKADAESTMKAIIGAVHSYGGAEVIEQRDDYLYVVFTTPTMKFHDDAEFWLDQTNQRVHFRSQSRSGYSDRGLNRQRFDALVDFYQAQ